MLKTLNSVKRSFFKIENKTYRFFMKNISYFTRRGFAYKDEAFWEDYSKRKSQGGRVPALESQEIIMNKTVHSWKFADKHCLSVEELLVSIRELEPKKDSPFVILDVREEVEYDIYKLPDRNKVELN